MRLCASGKTTLAKGLAKAFACDLYPRRSYDRTYIEDLYREPRRWTTEAQISFMVHKYDEIRRGIEQGKLFIVDRSFDEEIDVFAERFHDDGTIDTRSMELLRQLAADLRQRLEPPALSVFCECPVEKCRERLAGRPRSYQQDYPSDHLERLDERLHAWLSRQTTATITIDTVTNDFRDETKVLEVARQIDGLLTGGPADQLDLFGGGMSTSPVSQATRPSLLRKRRVYLAAPFTTRANLKARMSPDERYLFGGDGATENIPTAYRRQLSSLARAIESHGHEVHLPHRDINRWGTRSLSSSEVARRCLAAVTDSDCLIGLIAESFGSHAEFAYALGLGKPSIILLCAREPTSFFGEGMSALESVTTIKAPSMAALTRSLRQSDPLARIQWSSG